MCLNTIYMILLKVSAFMSVCALYDSKMRVGMCMNALYMILWKCELDCV